jgi:signal transduction histidine kinase
MKPVRRLFDTLKFQTGLIAIAAVSLVVLAFLLVSDIVASTEERLVRDARRQCVAAARELAQQFIEQSQMSGAPPVPREAQDLSLRGATLAVLRSYPDLAGGFFVEGEIVGAAVYGSDEAPALRSLEKRLVQELSAGISPVGAVSERVAHEERDLVAAAAVQVNARQVAWAVKRLPAIRDPFLERRRWLLALLACFAALGLAGVISINLRLRRGVEAIGRGVRRLETDFEYRLPDTGGEFGVIARAVNEMAAKRAALEAGLRRQDRLAALGRVAAGVAHEIRNPLNALRLTLELLSRRVRRGESSPVEVAGVMDEVDKLDRTVARLLAFGRPDLRDRRVQDLMPLVERAVRVVSQQSATRGVAVEIAAGEPRPLEADVDGLEIEQVIINLLMNAVDAAPAGSTVCVRVDASGRQVLVQVHDDGVGIPASAREHIFDPYFTTKETGTGLGLAVSREIVAHHGGQLELVSNGSGTTFEMRLPRSKVTQ